MNDSPATGWILGLGLVPGSWIAAGIISTFLPEPESAFPWALVGCFVIAAGGLVWTAVRSPGLRRTAALGAGISILLTGALALAIVLAAP